MMNSVLHFIECMHFLALIQLYFKVTLVIWLTTGMISGQVKDKYR